MRAWFIRGGILLFCQTVHLPAHHKISQVGLLDVFRHPHPYQGPSYAWPVHLQSAITASTGWPILNDKCEFSRSSVAFLGHIVDSTFIWGDPPEQEAINSYSVPVQHHLAAEILGHVDPTGPVHVQPYKSQTNLPSSCPTLKVSLHHSAPFSRIMQLGSGALHMILHFNT